jgi:hypothetical protein
VHEDLERVIKLAKETNDPSAAREMWRLRHRYNIFDIYYTKPEPHADDPVLCYVDLPWMYFTTQNLESQWGDDWNDAPYEHNAGEPYEPVTRGYRVSRTREYKTDAREDGTPGWRIIKVAVETSGLTPEGRFMGDVSVQEINDRTKNIPWLRFSESEVEEHGVSEIVAGTPLSEVRRLIRQSGGRWYEEAGDE